MRSKRKSTRSCNSSLHLKREREKKSQMRDFLRPTPLGILLSGHLLAFQKHLIVFSLTHSLPSTPLSLSLSFFLRVFVCSLTLQLLLFQCHPTLALLDYIYYPWCVCCLFLYLQHVQHFPYFSLFMFMLVYIDF